MWQVETKYVKEITKPKAVRLKSVFRAVMFPLFPWETSVIYSAVEILESFVRHRSDRILDFVGPNKILSDQTFYKAYC